MEKVAELVYWITNREDIRHLKEAGAPLPWTQDKILRNYRFCNVHREDDRVTRWITEHWRSPFSNHPDIWFWMMIARVLNQPESIVLLPSPSAKWDPVKDFIRPLQAHKAKGGRIFNAAYVVSTNGKKSDKVEYLAHDVLAPAWVRRGVVRPKEGDTLDKFASRLLELNGLAGFMAGQIIADVKYTGHLENAEDWMTFAISGPGSRRGLNRICGRELEARWNEHEWHEKLIALRDTLIKKHNIEGKVGTLHAQDLQNCLCEFDKWCRGTSGEGTPKQIYRAYKEEN